MTAPQQLADVHMRSTGTTACAMMAAWAIHTSTPSDSDELWTSENPMCGVVRHVFLAGNYAGQLDDLNGDYREVCFNLFAHESGGWERLVSRDDVGYSHHRNDFSTGGYDNPLVWAAGCGRARDRVVITLFGRKHVVTTDADGWWLFVKERVRPPARRLGKHGLIVH
jgi:hypothetical protein